MDRPDEVLLATLLSESPDGLALIGTDLRFIRVNRVMARITGAEQAAHVGKTIDQMLPPAMAAAAESAVRTVLDGGPRVEHVTCEVVGPASMSEPRSPARPGGRNLRTVATVPGRTARDRARSADRRDPARTPTPLTEVWDLSCYPAVGNSQEIIGAVIIAADITDQRAVQVQLRRTRERYHALVQAATQIVWTATPSGAFVEDAPEWRRVTGQSAAEYLSAGWLGAVHPEDRDRMGRQWQSCLSAGTAFGGTCRVRTAGAFRRFDLRAVPVRRDDRVVEWVGVSTDVTSQREAEEMRGRLTEQLSAAALRTARLQQATSMLAEALTVEQVGQVIAQVGRTAIGAERCTVAVLDPETPRLRVIVSPGDQDAVPATDEIPLDDASIFTAAVMSRRPVMLDSRDALRRYFADRPGADHYLRNSDERSWVVLPLLSSGRVLGAVLFAFTWSRRLSNEDQIVLEALAGQCALAMERAAMYEREHATAAALQRSLLPDRLPVVPGIVLEARYSPAARNMEIGGDWYDAFRLPDGKLAVATGDVMGKGLTAAAGMGRVRNALRALALTDPRPAAVLAGLDRLFLATELDEQVTTVAYLAIDPVTGAGTIGNAGHLPMLLLTPGTTARLDQSPPGTPLGWASPRQQHQFRLAPGDTAVLYSDGLVENRRRGLDAGLAELVVVGGQAPPERLENPRLLLGYLVDQMLAGHEQDDDVTVLVVHRPRSGELSLVAPGTQ